MINVNISAFMRSDDGVFVNLSMAESFFIEDLVITQEFMHPNQAMEKVTKRITLNMPTGSTHHISMNQKELESFMKNGVCLIGKKQ